MSRQLFYLCIILFSFTIFQSCHTSETKLETAYLSIILNQQGRLVSMMNQKTGVEYLDPDSASYLVSIASGGKVHFPSSIFLEGENLEVRFDDVDLDISLSVGQYDEYVRLEVLGLSSPDVVDVLFWGPYLTSIDETIGETIGVVRDGEFAIGVQSLNPKTLGGYPWNENDAMPEIDIFENGDFSDLSEEGKRMVLYRVEAAKPTKTGSSLQAYVRNRNTDRVVKNLNHDYYLVPAYNDGGVTGSAIALFGSPTAEILDRIETIEIKEGLPHPEIDGAWGKRNAGAAAAYMILGFGETDIEKAVNYTKRAGLRYLYHPGPFKTWGRFEWNDAFPSGNESMRRCVEVAESQGIMLGLHTLSNFITTNDSYVTPTPDPRLGKVGFSLLSKAITQDATEIGINDPVYFDQFRNNHLRTIQIGEELIQYGGVTKEEPYLLTDCQRGAFGTVRAAHSEGEKVFKLADHGYKVFLSDPALSIEIAENIADIYNETGVRQISFDGLEGNRSTGMGNYGEVLFTNAWYQALDDDIKSHYIADASRTSHYFWHMYTRMNWGEPWYAGFRESQQEYRLKNQPYFKRNLMPAMLGWFLFRENTSIEDIEWLLARSAGFDAGYAFVGSYDAFERNGYTNKVLSLVGTWEKLRIGGTFTEDQKLKMQDVNREFTLSGNDTIGYFLHEVYVARNKHLSTVKQPGEPLHTTTSFNFIGDKQPIVFTLAAPKETPISNVWIEIDNYKKLSIPGQVPAGHYLKYSGGDDIEVLDSEWNTIRSIKIDQSKLLVDGGDHTVQFDCTFQKIGEEVNLEFRALGPAEPVH